MLAMVVAPCCIALQARVLSSLGRLAEGILLRGDSSEIFFFPFLMFKGKEKS